MSKDSPTGGQTPRRLPDAVLQRLKARLKAARGFVAGEFDEQGIRGLMRYYEARKLEALDPRFCASFLRDVENWLLPPEDADELPAFEVPGVEQAKILPRATAPRLARIRNNVPGELLDLPAWVAADRSGRRLKSGLIKSSKIPVDPHTGAEAKSNDPTTWGTFEQAAEHALGSIECFGVGINLLGSEYLGLDLDDVIGTDGNLHPTADEFISKLPPTYIEVSPSGAGLRIFYRGRKPDGLKRTARKDAFGDGMALEVYDGQSGARYLTVTGNVWQDSAGPIAEVDDTALQPIVELFTPPRRKKATKSKPTKTDPSSVDLTDFESVAEHGGRDLTRAQWGLLEVKILDPDAGYSDWFRVLAALKTLGDDGLRIAVEWSKDSEDFDEQEILEKWPGITGTDVANLFGMFDDASPSWRREFEQAETLDHFTKVVDEDEPLVLSTQRTMTTAEIFVRTFYEQDGNKTLVSHAGQFLAWNGSCYQPVEDGTIRNQLQPWLHNAMTQGKKTLVPFPANSTTLRQALDAIRDYVHRPANTPIPAWIGGDDAHLLPSEILPCRSMMLHIPSQKPLKPTPLFLNTCALSFDFDHDAPPPERWLAFLDEIFDGDSEQITLLQQWFGYVLTADTTQQKILLIVGPRRSGKGTLARVLHQLLGTDNVVSPTTSGLAGQFGLQPLIGKSLAIISDARFRGEGVNTVVERLLCISGEDAITIDRKYLGGVTLKLPTRFMILTNELPRLNDNSTALAGRFLALRLRRSFYGKEDTGLTAKLSEELPGILKWAIEGWEWLRLLGEFTKPTSASTVTEEMEDLASPVQAFVRERCIVAADERVPVDDLWQAWLQWLHDDGRKLPPTRQTFLNDIRTLLPDLKRRRGTGNAPFYQGIGLRQEHD